MAFNPMFFAFSALIAERLNVPAQQALPLAFIGSEMQPPIIGLVLALGLRGNAPTATVATSTTTGTGTSTTSGSVATGQTSRAGLFGRFGRTPAPLAPPPAQPQPVLNAIEPPRAEAGHVLNVILAGTHLAGGTINTGHGIAVMHAAHVPAGLEAKLFIGTNAPAHNEITVTTPGGTSNAVAFSVAPHASAAAVGEGEGKRPSGKI